jgi:hypothetical protein
MANAVKNAVKVLAQEARREFSELSDEDWKETTIVVELLPGLVLGKFSIRKSHQEKGK